MQLILKVDWMPGFTKVSVVQVKVTYQGRREVHLSFYFTLNGLA